MTAGPEKLSSVGFVDTFENGHFTGWVYTNSNAQQKLHLKINGFLIKTITANASRPDVKAAGIEIEHCGFNFKLPLEELPQDGCSITLHEVVYDGLLTSGALTYQNGKITPNNDIEAYTDKLPVKSYINVYNAASANQDTTALLELSMKVLSKLPSNTLVAMSYLLILGRIPDPEGFKGSLTFKLTTAGEKRDFLANMINSMEFATKRTVASATGDLEKFIA